MMSKEESQEDWTLEQAEDKEITGLWWPLETYEEQRSLITFSQPASASLRF